MNTIVLSGYNAKVSGASSLSLGTWDSYGIEQIQIQKDAEWDNLTITATFITPGYKIRVVVPESGIIDVPPEATKQPLTKAQPGKIVFSGVAKNLQRITTDVIFTVLDHSEI